jgi:hypothetical protein
MLSPHILDAKIINNQGELYGTRFLFSEAWAELFLAISVNSDTARQELVCQYTCLWQTIHALLNLNVDMSIQDQGQQVIFCNDF